VADGRLLAPVVRLLQVERLHDAVVQIVTELVGLIEGDAKQDDVLIRDGDVLARGVIDAQDDVPWRSGDDV